MCGRFTLASDLSTILKRFLIEKARATPMPLYNIAPAQQVPVILNDGGRVLMEFRWGLIPSWAKEPAIGQKLINARAETIRETPGFQRPFQRSRCLVPADGFYEWKLTRTSKGKIPMRIRLKSREPFAMAGLWDSWKDAEGREIRSFTIITTEPNALMQTIHNRMPALLSPRDEAVWLDPAAEASHLVQALKPYPAEEMEAYEVSKAVNNVRNNSPHCIEPAAPQPPPSLFDAAP